MYGHSAERRRIRIANVIVGCRSPYDRYRRRRNGSEFHSRRQEITRGGNLLALISTRWDSGPANAKTNLEIARRKSARAFCEGKVKRKKNAEKERTYYAMRLIPLHPKFPPCASPLSQSRPALSFKCSLGRTSAITSSGALPPGEILVTDSSRVSAYLPG